MTSLFLTETHPFPVEERSHTRHTQTLASAIANLTESRRQSVHEQPHHTHISISLSIHAHTHSIHISRERETRHYILLDYSHPSVHSRRPAQIVHVTGHEVMATLECKGGVKLKGGKSSSKQVEIRLRA